MQQEQIEIRKVKGLEIAKTSRISKVGNNWHVPSQSGSGFYIVQSNGFGATCTCPDYELRKCKCKHVFAVEFVVTKEVDNEGNVTITQTIRKTYSQNWSKYDKASINQKSLFMKLLKDITSNLKQPDYEFGRPTLPISDMAYSSVMKVFTTFSLRRFMSDMQIAKEKGYINAMPCYASVGHFMQKKEITPLLVSMITLTSLPLRTIEKDFAIDSTGFGTSIFQRWYSFKYGKEISSRKWVKCHFITGAKTNIIPSVKITTEFDNDCPQLSELVNKATENFNMEELSGDKAYLSQQNLEIIDEKGALPFIPFKTNSQANKNGMIWKKMFYFFQLNNEDFLQHYHKRSNAETSVMMVKSKFGGSVRSKTWIAQINEVLCKIICHNIVCVIHEMHSLGIEPNFNLKLE